MPRHHRSISSPGPARAERPAAVVAASGSVSPSLVSLSGRFFGVCSARGRARQRLGHRRLATAGRAVRPSTAAGSRRSRASGCQRANATSGCERRTAPKTEQAPAKRA